MQAATAASTNSDRRVRVTALIACNFFVIIVAP